MTRARRAGIPWTAFIARYCNRTNVALFALLLLSAAVDLGVGGAPASDAAGRLPRQRHAAELGGLTGTESKIQPGRPTAVAEAPRSKPRLSGDGGEPRLAFTSRPPHTERPVRLAGDLAKPCPPETSPRPPAARPRAPPALGA